MQNMKSMQNTQYEHGGMLNPIKINPQYKNTHNNITTLHTLHSTNKTHSEHKQTSG